MSRSQPPGKSKYSFRLIFFTALSVLACMLALANVASAATGSGEDQYIEKAPSGGGNSGKTDDDPIVVDANGDGVVTEAEVKEAAEKEKKKAKKKAKAKDEGATGATGASGTAAGTTPTPPPTESVATAAKFGPVSKPVAFGLALMSILALIAFKTGFAASIASSLGIGGSGASIKPPTAG